VENEERGTAKEGRRKKREEWGASRQASKEGRKRRRTEEKVRETRREILMTSSRCVQRMHKGPHKRGGAEKTKK
jgi:hypothetical protein